MLGWSGETENNVWRKTDVSLDETDLARLLREAELPEDMPGKLSTKLAHMLLDAESEILLTGKMVSFGYPEDAAQARIKTLTRHKEMIFDKLRSLVPAT